MVPHEPILDRAALVAYKQRLADLDEQLDAARTDADLAAQQRATDEREFVLAELRRATRPGGASRRLGATTAERAHKAVTGRIRDAIRHISEALPDLGAHLDRTIRTGATCRYDARPDRATTERLTSKASRSPRSRTSHLRRGDT
jgi:hypothetical protein